MQRRLNLKVKRRESFRPFAPAVLAECAADWFELETASPYMLVTAHARVPDDGTDGGAGEGEAGSPPADARLPAVTHVDGSARVQTVHRETNPRFHALLTTFRAQTGCPALVNTSFNVRGEPIVCTPDDAWRCFMGTDLDWLAIGNFLLKKEAQAGGTVAGVNVGTATD